MIQAAWDDLTAVGYLDEFCNIVTLTTLEAKLPQDLQIQWAKEKIKSKLNCSKECMFGLKAFSEDQRKVASDVLLMRGKSESKHSPGDSRNSKFNFVIATGHLFVNTVAYGN